MRPTARDKTEQNPHSPIHQYSLILPFRELVPRVRVRCYLLDQHLGIKNSRSGPSYKTQLVSGCLIEAGTDQAQRVKQDTSVCSGPPGNYKGSCFHFTHNLWVLVECTVSSIYFRLTICVMNYGNLCPWNFVKGMRYFYEGKCSDFEQTLNLFEMP